MSSDLQWLKAHFATLRRVRVARRRLLQAGLVAGGTAIGTATSHGQESEAGSAIAQQSLMLAPGLEPGTTLVTSLRLPLPGIGVDQVAPLLQGEVVTWSDLWCPLPMPVSLVVIDGHPLAGGTPTRIVPDYEGLVEALDADPGACAMIPFDLIDARVNTLDLDGVSPLAAGATDESPLVRIGIAGDIIFGRRGGEKQRAFDDWLLPMYQVKDFMKSFDVTVANFECFVSETIDLDTVDNLDFVTRPESLQGLVEAGIDAVTMANNHAVYSHAGYGVAGMQETMAHLNNYGIPPFGVGMNLDEARAPWVTEVDGVSIAFIGIDGVTANDDHPVDEAVVDTNVGATVSSAGTNPFRMERVITDIESLAAEYDIVLPYFHMGSQYKWIPVQWVVDAARRSVDAGATAVLSSHPHATMGMEFYKGKPIFYSIGNFVYDQMFSVETREGYFLELTFLGKTLKGFRIHPVETQAWVQPRFMSGLQTASFNDRFWRSTNLTRIKRNWNPVLTRPLE